MVITYYGLTCFKVQSGETALLLDSFPKESGLTPPRFQTDVVLATSSAYGNGASEGRNGDTLVITGPGEYETKGIVIDGIAAGESTIYIIEWDGMRLCHLGAAPQKAFTDEVLGLIGTPDVLFVPVGGGNSLTADEASALVNQIEPRIIIPMHFKTAGLKTPSLESPEKFIAEFGEEGVAPQEKFTFKLKDLPQEGARLVYLEPVTSQK